MKISMNMKGDQEFARKIKELGRYMKDFRPVYKSWGIEAVKWITENYRSGGQKAGGWKPLRPGTLRSRRKASDRPLLNTGHLMRLWNYAVKGWGVVVGNPSEVAKFHEKGTKGPYPIRPVNRKMLWFGVTPAERRRGQQLGGHAVWRVASKPYRPWGKGKTPGTFAKEVMHPGLPARRQLPKEREIMPRLIKVVEVFIEKAARRANLK